MKKTIILLALGSALVACKSNNTKSQSTEPTTTESVAKEKTIHIRLANKSAYNFTDIQVSNPTDKVSYGNLNAGATSDYIDFETAYSYASVTLKIDDKTYTFQPIDYVSETPLKDGNYTYEINVEDLNNTMLDLKLVEDK